MFGSQSQVLEEHVFEGVRGVCLSQSFHSHEECRVRSVQRAAVGGAVASVPTGVLSELFSVSLESIGGEKLA